MPTPYPLTFEPMLKEKVWGGRRLARYGKRLAEGKRYGESWELADLPSTSAGGGGGGAARSVIDAGAMAGKTIHDALQAWGERLLGRHGMERAREVGGQIGAGGPVFPLLLKYLDAAEHLSVQVHPSPAYARAHAGAHLKTESWLVVEAEATSLPDGTHVAPTLFTGVKAGVTAAAFREHALRGTVAADLEAVDALAGDCHTLPSGTCHALGGGVLVAEVQTPSDTTFRVYDWVKEYRRPERELHLERAIECIDFAPGGSRAPEALRREAGAAVGRVATTPYYFMDEAAPDASAELTASLASGGGSGGASGGVGALCLMVLAGRGVVRAADGSFADVALTPGRTVLVPAACVESARVEGDGLLGLRVGVG